MDGSVRSSSAPLSGRIMIDTSESRAKKKTMLPRSPGYFPSEYSAARLEFQDSKRSIDELKELARTTSPDPMAIKPTFTERSSGSHVQKPLERLFRLSRSTTTSDLNDEKISGESLEMASMRETIPQACLEMATKHSSGGRSYTKIAINPKMYTVRNPSTLQVNFEKSKAEGKSPIAFQARVKKSEEKGKSHDWLSRKSQSNADHLPQHGGSENPPMRGHVSHSSSEPGYGQKVTDAFSHLILGRDTYNPTKSGTNPASHGYSPSKRTLVTAQARARSGSSGHPFRSQERPIGKHRNHFARRRTSAKGPYSVPIKFQLRHQRASLPKTPRTSFDEPVAPKVSSPDPIKGPAAHSVSSSPISPIESSPAKSGRSFIDECQSDAESGTIMSAQQAEFIHGQGAYAYHHPSSSRQPPKPGPAPTRALLSLPEGHDGTTPKSTAGKTPEYQNVLASEHPSGCGSSPSSQSKPPAKSPPKKGHRYRLSPVKNRVPSESRILKPSPTFTEVFPLPPTSSTSLARKSSEAISPRTRNREFDASTLVPSGRSLDLLASNFKNGGDAIAQPGSNNLKTVDGQDGPSSSSAKREFPISRARIDKDAERDNLDIPWHGSCVESVKALKIRDIERARQGGVEIQRHCDDEEAKNVAQPARERGGTVTGQDAVVPSSSSEKGNAFDQGNASGQRTLDDRKGEICSFVNSTEKIGFSPIIVVAKQPPCSTSSISNASSNPIPKNERDDDSSPAAPQSTYRNPQRHPQHPSLPQARPQTKRHPSPSIFSLIPFSLPTGLKSLGPPLLLYQHPIRHYNPRSPPRRHGEKGYAP
ncbi:MAG: hypothetical protein L6R42_000002 [Xanthoria sp. 1 TBL-2021]|nr:MAG: hypothetical protein L6R42_000002 [Xanthoria sp. 1 TBL-2021]